MTAGGLVSISVANTFVSGRFGPSAAVHDFVIRCPCVSVDHHFQSSSVMMESSDLSPSTVSSPSADQSSSLSSVDSSDVDITSLLNDSLEMETEVTHKHEELPCDLSSLRQSFDSNDWIDVSNCSFSELRLCKIGTFPTGSLQPPAITHYLVVYSLGLLLFTIVL